MVNSASELALVGPDITCQLDPNRAAMMQGITAVYSPYSGGRPASVAKAMPCGNTSTAPSKPASASARSVAGDTREIQLPRSRSGRLRAALVLWGSAAAVMALSLTPHLHPG